MDEPKPVSRQAAQRDGVGSINPSQAHGFDSFNMNGDAFPPLNDVYQQLPDIAQMSLEHFERTDLISNDREDDFISHQTRNQNVNDSFLLIDESELMQISSSDDFAERLGCTPGGYVKVVSIFGNTGEGKSHTLNYTFFDGSEMFKTSPAQSSCTIGIWAAYDPQNRVITIDTEGLLGLSENNNKRTRLLMKVLAVSDVVIYRTRAERLHNDLFTFLGDASRAYMHHFSTELKAAAQRCSFSGTISDLGPVVVIFHETLHTEVLKHGNSLLTNFDQKSDKTYRCLQKKDTRLRMFFVEDFKIYSCPQMHSAPLNMASRPASGGKWQIIYVF